MGSKAWQIGMQGQVSAVLMKAGVRHCHAHFMQLASPAEQAFHGAFAVGQLLIKTQSIGGSL